MGFFNRMGDAEHHEQRSVALDGATSANVRVDMTVGELVLTGGATDLMQGDFMYDTELEPIIGYDVRDGVGELSVTQSRKPRAKQANRNRWEIALNDDVPVSLHLHMATGRLEADLSSLRLTSVRISQSTGEGIIDVGGHQLMLTELKYEQATGNARLILDGDYAAFTNLRVQSAVGRTELDFGGSAWGQDLNARVEVTTGHAIVRLPRDVGVEARTRSTLGKITARGLVQDGNHYYNEAFDSDNPVLRLDLRAAIGKIELEVVD